MRFNSLMATILAATLTLGCEWEDKYQAADCDGSANSEVVDCRSVEDIIDTVETVSLERVSSALLSLTQAGSDSWGTSHADELNVFLEISGQSLFVGSKFHNRLRSLQSNNAGQVTLLGDVSFLSVSGDRYTVDGVTGASEQLLSGIHLDDSTSPLIIIAQTEKYNNQSGSTGVGSYFQTVQSLDALPSPEFASGTATDFIGFGNIRGSALCDNGLLATTGSDRSVNLVEFSNENKLSSVSLDVSGRSLACNDSSDRLYLGGATIVGQVLALSVALDTFELSEVWRATVADTPKKMLAVGDSSVLVLLASGTELLWFSADGQSVSAIELAAAGTDIAINAEQNQVAVTDVDGGVELIHLSSGKRAYAKVGVAGSVGGVGIDQFGTVWALNDGKVTGYLAPAGFSE